MAVHFTLGPWGLLSAVAIGLSAGALSAVLTTAVYAAEDFFQRLPIHWMWWPALGGLVIGIGGLIDPNALGVGYDTIADLLQGKFGLRLEEIVIIRNGKAEIFSEMPRSAVAAG